jgi:hypothetical protein
MIKEPRKGLVGEKKVEASALKDLLQATVINKPLWQF